MVGIRLVISVFGPDRVRLVVKVRFVSGSKLGDFEFWIL